MKLPSRRTRAYIYRVAVAVGAALVAKGLITEGDFLVYEAVATAVLGLAAVNTPTKDE